MIGFRSFNAVVREARRLKLLVDGRFNVGGTLIEACASLKSF